MFLVGCGPRETAEAPSEESLTSSPSEDDKEQVTADPNKQFEPDEVLKAVNEARAKTWTGFSMNQYSYQFNKVNSQVTKDTNTKMTFHAYTNGFEAEQTNEEGEGTYSDFKVTSSNSGTLSSYALEDPSIFAYGYQAKQGDHDDDFYNELEVNKWQDASKTFDNTINGIMEDVTKGATGEGFWTSKDGYATDYSTDVVDGNYVFKRVAYVTATDEELQQGYADEENYVEYTLSPSLELLSYTYHTKIYNTHVDSGINGENYIHLEGIQYGERTEKQDISKITDLSVIPAANVITLSHKVEVPEGNISSDKVLELFKNLSYYAKGTKSSHNEYVVQDYAADGTYDSKVIEDSTAYQDYITIVKGEKTDGKTQEKTVTEDQTVGKDTRVEITHKKGEEFTYDFPIDPLTLGYRSENNFNPSGFYPNSLFFAEAKSFGEENNGFSITNRTLNSATNTDGKISIDWSLDSTYPTLPSIPETHKNFKITIDNGFLSKIEIYEPKDNKQTLTGSYTMTKGELDKYTGELFTYQEPDNSGM